MDNKTFKKMLLGMAMASPLALINSGNVHASSVKTNVETNWHANSLATVQQELRNQNINPDYKITNAKYIVQAGDTLSQIAAATHINMYHIAAVNHIQNLNLIYVGQVLILNQGNEVAHNVAGNGSTTAASIGNTYTLRSTSRQSVLNYYGHTQAQGTTGTPNVQRTANVNSQGAPAAKQPAKTIIPSTPSAANNNQNTKPTTPTGNTGVNTGSHVAGNTSTNTGSTVTPNTQGSASQTGSSATQNNNSQKTPTVDSSSASQQPASSASSASQPTGSSQAQGSVNTGSTATPSNSQKTPTVDSSSASSNTQQPAQSSSSQSSVSSSSQQTTTSSSSAQQPASSASSSSQSTASTNSSSQSSASQQAPAQSSSSQSSASSSSQQPASSASSSSQSSTASSASSSSQKTVDGYTLDNMPLSVFNDKKNLNAINNTFSGDAIENYFNNHIGKGNMTWDEAQQAQQNGTITSAILSWNGQMLPTQMSQDMAKNNGVMANAIYNWRGMLPVSYLNGDNQMTEINKQYGSLNGDTLNQAQSEKLTSYLNSLLETYPGAGNKGTNAKLQEIANERAEKMTTYSHDGWDSNDTSSEVLADLGNINSFQNKSMFDVLANSANGMYLWMYRDGGQDSVSVMGQAWGHRDALKEYSNWAFSIKVLSNGEVILIGEGQ